MLPNPKENQVENRRGGIAVFILIFLVVIGLLSTIGIRKEALLGLLVIIPLGGWIYFQLTKKARFRKKITNEPFPEEWKKIIETKIGFYHTLNTDQKERFKELVRLFISEKRIVGVKTEIDDTIRILVAASAIIPVFGFKEWEYTHLGEVLITEDYLNKGNRGEGEGYILGQVQVRHDRNTMVLSKESLQLGFQNMDDKNNVGVHEFAHVLDLADGKIDGIPKAYIPAALVEPWTNLMYDEMQKIKDGESTIKAYGATNEAEFFAVVTEYFFENPKLLERKHPELYIMLKKVYKQNTSHTFNIDFQQILHPFGKRINRNSPCPCGSKKKYKKCCLK